MFQEKRKWLGLADQSLLFVAACAFPHSTLKIRTAAVHLLLYKDVRIHRDDMDLATGDWHTLTKHGVVKWHRSVEITHRFVYL
jgi:hypothetical protein